MTKRLVLRWSIALLLVVGSAAAYAAPLQSLAELRALSCCTHDCHHGAGRAVDPERCCGVAQADTAAPAASAAPAAAPALVATLHAISVSPAALASFTPLSGRVAARAAPLFLLTRSLRI